METKKLQVAHLGEETKFTAVMGWEQTLPYGDWEEAGVVALIADQEQRWGHE